MYILIVTGMSGSGKTTALKNLEAMGFYCIDNLPSSMLCSFQKLCEESQPPIARAAITVDGRESLLNTGYMDALREIDKLTCRTEILFLDARDDILMERYNEHRRTHPLGENGDPSSGVRVEREYLKDMRERADYILDTSDVKSRDFPQMLRKILPEIDAITTNIVLCSFGYKRGVPVDADMVFDMRFIENPYYVKELRLLCGLDKEVADFIEKQPMVDSFLQNISKTIIELLPYYQKQKKVILRVCFGCTGGRHRSVYAAQHCAMLLKSAGLSVRTYHRDLQNELTDILTKK